MRWNLRMVAAQRGIWKSTDLRRALGAAGLDISAGKMSNLWSGTPISVRLDDMDVICSVLGCTPDELLAPEEPAERAEVTPAPKSAASESGPAIRPTRRHSRQRAVPPA